jgi:hypothetical protein
MALDVDDAAVVSIARLFNERAGRCHLARKDVPEEFVSQLDLLGFSGIANLIASVKFAKYYELGKHDLVLTVLTDSMDLYRSRLEQMQEEGGEYGEVDAASDFSRYLQGISTDHLQELTYADRRRVHNLKYFTWIEQQNRTVDEMQAQWYSARYWNDIQKQAPEIDALITEFNARAGVQ